MDVLRPSTGKNAAIRVQILAKMTLTSLAVTLVQAPTSAQASIATNRAIPAAFATKAILGIERILRAFQSIIAVRTMVMVVAMVMVVEPAAARTRIQSLAVAFVSKNANKDGVRCHAHRPVVTAAVADDSPNSSNDFDR